MTGEPSTMSLEDLESIVRALILENDGLEVRGCLDFPSDCDPTWANAEEGHPRAIDERAVYRALAPSGRTYVVIDDSSYTAVRSIAFDATRTRATVLSCRWTAVVSTPSAGSGSVFITTNSYDHESLMVWENDRWTMSANRLLAQTMEFNVCPPKVS
jgi:hypothetical protein